MSCPKVTEVLLCLTYLMYLNIFLLLFPKAKFQINKLQKKHLFGKNSEQLNGSQEMVKNQPAKKWNKIWTYSVGYNLHIFVVHNRRILVWYNRHILVGYNRHIMVGYNRHILVNITATLCGQCLRNTGSCTSMTCIWLIVVFCVGLI